MTMSVQQVQNALESANLNWERQMGELRGAFTSIEAGWTEHQRKFAVIEQLHASKDSELGSFKQEITETKAQIQKTTEYAQIKFAEVDSLQAAIGVTIQQCEAGIKSLNAANPAQGGAPGGTGNRKMMDQLINPQNYSVEVFEEKDKAKFGKGRKRMLTFLDLYYDDIAVIMKALRNCSTKIDERAVDQAGRENNVAIMWGYDKTNKEIATFILTKLGVGPSELAETAGENGFEMMRLLTQRYDPIGVQTQAKLLNRITNLIHTPGPAKTFQETEARVTLLDRFVKDYEERLEKAPSAEVVASTFTNIVDPGTKKVFIEKTILDDYDAMRSLLNDLASQLLHQTSSPMDLGQFAAKESGPEQSQTPPPQIPIPPDQ